MTASSISTFDRLSAAAPAIEFNPLWANATGYYDNAVYGAHAPVLQFGEVKTCVDLKNRRLVLIGTSKGNEEPTNIVLFDRYSDRNGVIVSNWTAREDSEMHDAFGIDLSSRVSEDTLAKFCKVFAESMDFKGNTANPERMRLLSPWSVA